MNYDFDTRLNVVFHYNLNSDSFPQGVNVNINDYLNDNFPDVIQIDNLHILFKEGSALKKKLDEIVKPGWNSYLNNSDFEKEALEDSIKLLLDFYFHSKEFKDLLENSGVSGKKL